MVGLAGCSMLHSIVILEPRSTLTLRDASNRMFD